MNLAILLNEIKKIMMNEVKEIVVNSRNGNMSVIEEKKDGDSATNADIQIGQLFVKKLKEMLPNSIVINEEDFNEKVYEQIKSTKYIWIVDPIDGTKAFRTPGNTEFCIGVALLENLKPVLSVVYIPEYEINKEKGLLFEAVDGQVGARLNGKIINVDSKVIISEIKCINHIHRDFELNDIEKQITKLCKSSEKIRAYDGHSTLVNYALVSADKLQRIFTRRGANIWDIVQSAYIVEKTGGEVYYKDGRNIFPIRIEDLTLKENKLIMDFNIASAKTVKDEIIKKINNL